MNEDDEQKAYTWETAYADGFIIFYYFYFFYLLFFF